MADIKISAMTSASTLTGAEVIPALQSGANVKTTAQAIADLGVKFKVYKALITKGGGGAITAKTLENTIGAIVWTNPLNGYLVATLSAAFTADKTYVLSGTFDNGGEPYFVTSGQLSANQIYLQMYKYDGTATGTPNFVDMPVEVQVYY